MIRFSGLDVISELNETTKKIDGFKEIRPETNITDDEVQEYWDDFFSKPIEDDGLIEDTLAINVYGRSEDEFSFEFDVENSELKKILDRFEEKNWSELSEVEKIELIKQLSSKIGEQLGVENIPQIEFYNASIFDCGAYDPEMNVIAINKSNFHNPNEIVDTIAHEMFHTYQFQRAMDPQSYMDLLYAYNFSNYIQPYVGDDGYVNFTDYQNQLIEAEAHAFASLFVMEEEGNNNE